MDASVTPSRRAPSRDASRERVKAALASVPAGSAGRLEEDDWGNPRFVLRLDATHLAIDALHDRLQAWIVKEVRPRLPGASAEVSFRYARPATGGPGEMDFEEVWHDVEAALLLGADTPLDRWTAEAWAALLPAFLALVHASGRPTGHRPDVSEGSME